MAKKVGTQEVTLHISADDTVTLELKNDTVKGMVESLGMQTRVYGYWRDNAISICAQFWGFNESDAKDNRDSVSEKRDNRGAAALYQFGVEKHPEYKDYLLLVARAETAKGTDEGRSLKDQADGLIKRIRTVANAMRQRVIGYFLEETADKTESGTREAVGARTLIQKFIADIELRMAKQAGKKAGWPEGDMRLARQAVFALNQVLQAANIEANPALVLATPPIAEKRTVGSEGKAAGPVESLSAEEIEALNEQTA